MGGKGLRRVWVLTLEEQRQRRQLPAWLCVPLAEPTSGNAVPGAARGGGRSGSPACRALCGCEEAAILTAVGGRNHSV